MRLLYLLTVTWLFCHFLFQNGQCNFVNFSKARSPDLFQYGMKRYLEKMSTPALEMCMMVCAGKCRGFGYSVDTGQCQLVQDQMYTMADELSLDGTHELFIAESAPDDETCRKDKKLVSDLSKLLSDPHASFHVEMSGSQTPSGNPLPFDVATVNHGLHYDVTAHQFRCPVSGKYLFGVNLHRSGSSSGQLYVTLYHNGNSIIRSDTEPATRTHQAQVSTATIIHCAAGDVVHASSSSVTETGALTSLSGVLLNRDVPLANNSETYGVYFNVWMSGNTVTNLHVGDVLKYNNIVHNAGGHYDSSTGMFRCPVTGVYLFSIQFRDGDDDAMLSVHRNNGRVASASTAHSIHGHDYQETAHDMAICRCTEGENVMVKVSYLESDTATRILAGNRGFTFFTGILLYGQSSSKQQASFAVTLATPPTSTRIKFDRVDLNDGGHYHNDTGEFACPVKGDYLFCMSMVSSINSTSCRARLMKNDTVLSEVLLKEGTTTTVGTSTGMVVAHCEPGDLVYVARYLCDDVTAIELDLTHFFGVLLHIY